MSPRGWTVTDTPSRTWSPSESDALNTGPVGGAGTPVAPFPESLTHFRNLACRVLLLRNCCFCYFQEWVGTGMYCLTSFHGSVVFIHGSRNDYLFTGLSLPWTVGARGAVTGHPLGILGGSQPSPADPTAPRALPLLSQLSER